MAFSFGDFFGGFFGGGGFGGGGAAPGGAAAGTPSGADLGISQAEVDRGVAAQAAIDAVDAGVPSITAAQAGLFAGANAVGRVTSTGANISTSPGATGGQKGGVEKFLDKNVGRTIKALIGLATGTPVGALKNPFVNADGTPKGLIGDVPGEDQGIDQTPGFDPVPAVKPKATSVTPVPGVTDGDADRPTRRGAGRISRFGQFSRRTILTGSRGLSTQASTTKKTLLGL